MITFLSDITDDSDDLIASMEKNILDLMVGKLELEEATKCQR